MPALHDMACSRCDRIGLSLPLSKEHMKCACGKGRMEILWTTHHHRDAAVHSSERTALYYSPKERKWQYPSENNKPIPDRLRKRGYERVEFPSLRALEQHGKTTGAMSEKAYFDSGTARGFDE